MKKIFLSFIYSLFLFLSLTLFSCKGNDPVPSSTTNSNTSNTNTSNTNTSLSNTQLLMLHSWTSVKVYNFGVDVTSTISALTYVFKINNIYTASSNTGSSDGSWSTSGNTLTLDGGGWTIIELTSTSLKISQGDIIIHFQ